MDDLLYVSVQNVWVYYFLCAGKKNCKFVNAVKHGIHGIKRWFLKDFNVTEYLVWKALKLKLGDNMSATPRKSFEKG